MENGITTIEINSPNAPTFQVVIDGAIEAIRMGDVILFPPVAPPPPPPAFVHARPAHNSAHA